MMVTGDNIFKYNRPIDGYTGFTYANTRVVGCIDRIG